MLRVSQDSNTKVRTVARVLVATHDGSADPTTRGPGAFVAHLPASGWPGGPTREIRPMNIDDAALAESLRRLSHPREDNGSVTSALEGVVAACVDLFGVGGAGVLIADEQDMLVYVAASDGPGRILEQTEAEAGEGPCTEAFVQGRVVTPATSPPSPSAGPPWRARWPTSPCGRCSARPVRWAACRSARSTSTEHAHDWDDSEAAALGRYAEVIATTLAAALQAHTAGELARQLQYALDYRVLIERAVGYLMAKESIDAVAAFNALRTAARSRRTKIGVVSEHVLETGRSRPE